VDQTTTTERRSDEDRRGVPRFEVDRRNPVARIRELWPELLVYDADDRANTVAHLTAELSARGISAASMWLPSCGGHQQDEDAIHQKGPTGVGHQRITGALLTLEGGEVHADHDVGGP